MCHLVFYHYLYFGIIKLNLLHKGKIQTMKTHTGTEILQASSENATEARILAIEKNNRELTLRLIALEIIEKDRQKKAEAEKTNIQLNPSHGLNQEVIDELKGEYSISSINKTFCSLEKWYKKKGLKVPYGRILTKKMREFLERNAKNSEKSGF